MECVRIGVLMIGTLAMAMGAFLIISSLYAAYRGASDTVGRLVYFVVQVKIFVIAPILLLLLAIYSLNLTSLVAWCPA